MPPEIVVLSILAPLSLFGSLAIVVRSIGRARIEDMKARHQMEQSSSTTPAVLTELQEMRQMIGEMQSTSHQFDLSFDAALSRLERRVEHLETKASARIVAEEPMSQRIGQG